VKRIFLGVIPLIVFLVVGCQQIQDEPPQAEDAAQPFPLWYTTVLEDVNSGERFSVSTFAGKTVLLESFAVWCPACTEQQKQTKKLDEELGDAVISISIDTDPNEDADFVREHTKRNGFTWRYAIAPKEFTLSLIDEFGFRVVNAPAVPLILICEDGSRRMLRRGVKSADDLKAEIAKGC